MYDWAAMQAFIDAGNGYTRCNKQFGIAHATWMKAIRNGEIKVDLSGRPYADARNRYDWDLIRAHYESGASVLQCIARFGFSKQSWDKAVRRGDITTRPRRLWTAAEAMANSKSRITIKRHLLRAGILENRCDFCGLTSWRGRPISIQIDHINGIRDDHRLENLRMLCPNCHSQTDTFAAKNRKSINKKSNGNPSSSNGRTASSDVAYGGSSPSLGA
jgi:5-methylcytosine-specific restriction endonuclease McrA